MIIETSSLAWMMIPMALSLGFGVIFSTAIILVMAPPLNMALGDLPRLMYKQEK